LWKRGGGTRLPAPINLAQWQSSFLPFIYRFTAFLNLMPKAV